MASDPDGAHPSVDNGEAMGSGVGTSTSPVAVVWCRQVDNEAESPGYTTVPEEFPGHRETLEAIRAVGHLTINIADTHDYWDPDPSQPLSYYPNLFLYPANGGRYTCVGRMFLSTEDRPRLGMKTLVLDTAQLLASGEFGPAVLRWHASMGGPRREGARPSPPPDPALYPVLGEGFLFHRGSTDPVLVVASDRWDAAVQTILEMIRVLPGSLVALGAVLAFPYFLPQPKTNLHELTEQIPLTLALMRVPFAEAAGERHAKRMASWESAPLTVRDLTAGIASARGKENLPLVLQYARDRADAKLSPISQRVDLVEVPRVRSHLNDPERQGGRDRRKEIWRIGTAMESAALLLQRARGRHVPVSVETAKRAQEYLHARIPESPPAPEPAYILPESGPVAAGQLPPWLQRPPDSEPAAPAEPEVVPVSVSDDPSLLHAPAPPPLAPAPPSLAPATALPPAAASPPSPAAPPAASAPRSDLGPTSPAFDLTALRAQIQAELIRYMDDRLTAMKAPVPPAGPATALDDSLQSDLDQRVDTRITAARDFQAREVARQITALEEGHRTARTEAIDAAETRLREGLSAHLAAELGRQAEATRQAVALQIARLIKDAEDRQHAAVAAEARVIESRLKESLVSGLSADLDRRFATSVDPKLGDLARRLEESVRTLSDASRTEVRAELARSQETFRARLAQVEGDLRGALAAQAEALRRESGTRAAEAPALVDQRLSAAFARQATETESREAAQRAALEARLTQLIESRLTEGHARVLGASDATEGRLTEMIESRVAIAEARVQEKVDTLVTETNEARLHGIADLQVRMQAYFDAKMREDQDRERQKYLELLARLKSEVDASLSRMVDSARFDSALREKIGRSTEAFRADTERLLDVRVANVEQQLRVELADLAEGLARVDAALTGRHADLDRLDQTVRSEIDDLDRRTQILADRLVPIVRKTWLKVAEAPKEGATAEVATQVNQLRREFNRDVRRLETELAERVTEIRERMETTITNQGRVWLTLVRQLSQLTEDRRAVESARAAAQEAVDGRDVTDSLDEIPTLIPSRRTKGPLEPDPVNPMDPEPEPEAMGAGRAPRGRLRRSAR